MWRMFRAAILGVLIGIVGGVIFGQVSYVKKYKDKVSREIMADAVMYNNSLDDSGRVIRLKVDYDGDMKSEATYTARTTGAIPQTMHKPLTIHRIATAITPTNPFTFSLINIFPPSCS